MSVLPYIHVFSKLRNKSRKPKAQNKNLFYKVASDIPYHPYNNLIKSRHTSVCFQNFWTKSQCHNHKTKAIHYVVVNMSGIPQHLYNNPIKSRQSTFILKTAKQVDSHSNSTIKKF